MESEAVGMENDGNVNPISSVCNAEMMTTKSAGGSEDTASTPSYSPVHSSVESHGKFFEES